MQKVEKKRTLRQNKSSHLLYEHAAKLCNEHGIDLPILLKYYRVQITPTIIKDIIRETGRIKFGKESTADHTTKELQACFEDFRQNLIEISNGAIVIEFPSIENTDEYLNSFEI